MASAGTITVTCPGCAEEVVAQVRIDLRPWVPGASSAIADVTAAADHECPPAQRSGS